MKTRSVAGLAMVAALMVTAVWSWNMGNGGFSVAAAAESRSQERAEAPVPPGDDSMRQFREACPMLVEGARVQVGDTENGVALTFTTETGDVGDLRGRVRRMAEMYETHRGRRSMMWKRMSEDPGGGMRYGRGRGMGYGAESMQERRRGARRYGRSPEQTGKPAPGPMPMVTTSVEDIDKGARLVLTPSDPAQLEALREHMRVHQRRLRSGKCWIPREQSSGSGEVPEK